MIITQKAILVNSKKFDNWNMKKELNIQMADKLNNAGLTKRAERMSECSNTISIKLCPDCGRYEITKAMLCRDRLCPVCSWRLSLKRYSEMTNVCKEIITKYPDNQWSFMTLTVQNCEPGKLDEVLNKMAEAFNRMRQRKIYKEDILGWARTVEVTFNKEDNTLHPHYHVLIIWNKNVDVLHQGARLLNHWIASVRDLIVSIKAQHIEDIYGGNNVVDLADLDVTKAVLETFKYTQKTSQVLNMPTSIFYQFAQNIARKRTVSYGGLIKKQMQLLHYDINDEVPEKMEDLFICKNCGSASLSEALYKWSFAERSYLLAPQNVE